MVMFDSEKTFNADVVRYSSTFCKSKRQSTINSHPGSERRGAVVALRSLCSRRLFELNEGRRTSGRGAIRLARLLRLTQPTGRVVYQLNAGVLLRTMMLTWLKLFLCVGRADSVDLSIHSCANQADAGERRTVV